MKPSSPSQQAEAAQARDLRSSFLNLHSTSDPYVPQALQSSPTARARPSVSLAASPLNADPLSQFLMASVARHPEGAVCPLIVVRRSVKRSALGLSTAQAQDDIAVTIRGAERRLIGAEDGRAAQKTVTPSPKSLSLAVTPPSVMPHWSQSSGLRSTGFLSGAEGPQSAPPSPRCSSFSAAGAVPTIVTANALVVRLLGFDGASSLVGRRFENMFCCYRTPQTMSAEEAKPSGAATSEAAPASGPSPRQDQSDSSGLLSSVSREAQPSVVFLAVPPPSLHATSHARSHEDKNAGGGKPAMGEVQLLIPPVSVTTNDVHDMPAAVDDAATANSSIAVSRLGAGALDLPRVSSIAPDADRAPEVSTPRSPSTSRTLSLAEIHSVDDLFAGSAVTSLVVYSLATGRYYSALSMCRTAEEPTEDDRVHQDVFLLLLAQIASGEDPASAHSLPLHGGNEQSTDAPVPVGGKRTTPPSPSLQFATQAGAAARPVPQGHGPQRGGPGLSYAHPVLGSPLVASDDSELLVSNKVQAPLQPPRSWWSHVRPVDRHLTSPTQPQDRSGSTTATSHADGSHSGTTSSVPFNVAASLSAALPVFSGPQSLGSFTPAKSATSAMAKQPSALLVPSRKPVATMSMTGVQAGMSMSTATGVGRTMQSRAVAIDEITIGSLRTKMMYIKGVHHVTVAEDVPPKFLTNFVLFAMLTQATLRKLREMGFKDMCCFVNIFRKAYLAIDFILPSEVKFLRKKLGSTRAAREAILHSLQRAYRVLEARQVLQSATSQQQQQQYLSDMLAAVHHPSGGVEPAFDDQMVGGATDMVTPGHELKSKLATARPLTDAERQQIPLASFLSEDLIEQIVESDAEVRLSAGNGASIRFPFITKERLALLDANPQVQLSSAKGLTVFGIAGANALTAQAAADADAPAPKIIPLQYDRAAEDFNRFQASLSTRPSAFSGTSASPFAGHPATGTSYGDSTTVSHSRDSGSVAQLSEAAVAVTSASSPVLIDVASPDAPHLVSEYIRPAAPSSVRGSHRTPPSLSAPHVDNVPTRDPTPTKSPVSHTTAPTALAPAILESPGDDIDFFSPSPHYASSSSSSSDDNGEASRAHRSQSESDVGETELVSSLSCAEEDEGRPSPVQSKIKRTTSGRRGQGATTTTTTTDTTGATTGTSSPTGGLPTPLTTLPPLAVPSGPADGGAARSLDDKNRASAPHLNSHSDVMDAPMNTTELPRVLEDTTATATRFVGGGGPALPLASAKRRPGGSTGGGRRE